MKQPVPGKTLFGLLTMLALLATAGPIAADTTPPATPAPGYVVVTTDVTYDPLDATSSAAEIDAFLLDKRNNHGFATYVATDSEWDIVAGADKQERLRRWLQDNRIRLNIEYVLLIGNPDPATGDVPMMDLTGAMEFPTDFNYAELTDTLPAAMDRRSRCEVKVGRIPYPGGEQSVLAAILAQTIAYNNENAYDAMSWRRKVLIPIHPLCGDGHLDPTDPVRVAAEHAADTAYQDGERLKDRVLIPNGWQYHRIYELDYGLTPPPETTPCSWDSVKAVWCDPATRAQFGAVLWITHGCAYHSVEVMDRTNAALLDPAHPSFVFQGSCENALTTEPQNLAYAMLKKGAITTVASTVTYVFNIDLPIDYFTSLIRDRGTAGEAYWDNNRGRITNLNLYGDPSARLNRLPYDITPSRRVHGSGAETGIITVTADPRYSWTASTRTRWIRITSGGSGTGNGQIDYSVDPNTGSAARVGEIRIGELLFTIEQRNTIQDQFPNVTTLPTTATPSCPVDFDNDGDLDAACSSVEDRELVLYRNDGPAAGGGVAFTPIHTVVPGIRDGAMAWSDFNNDGLVDVVVSGISRTAAGTEETITRLYKNEGRGGGTTWDFTALTTGLCQVQNSSLTWGDYDNDGDEDLLLTGLETSSGASQAHLYRNDGPAGAGAWNLTAINTILLPVHSTPIACSRAEWSDFDSDGDQDVILTGTASSRPATTLYRNEGAAGDRDWTFTDMSAALPNLDSPYFACGDYDSDGKVDIALSAVGFRDYDSAVYRNVTAMGDPTWTFIRVNAGLQDMNAQPFWADFDNDGDPDAAYGGMRMPGSELISGLHIFENDTNVSGTFKYRGVISGDRSYLIGDFDGDLDLDALTGGRGDPGGAPYNLRLYENLITQANTAPAASSALRAIVSGHDVSFGWTACPDDWTPSNGLSYNLYVGNTPAGPQIRSPHADTTSGYRRIVKPGVVNGGFNDTIKNLPGGRYWWSVQAIDASYVGGAFAADQTFTVNPTISGRVTNGGTGVAGVALRGLPGSVVTDANGYYSSAVPYDWTGTVMPYLSGGTWFTPGQRPYVRLMTDAPNQNFTVTGTANLRLLYKTEQPTNTWNIQAVLFVYNDGTTNLNLSDVKAQYWYRSEWPDEELMEIDDARVQKYGTSGRDIKAHTTKAVSPLVPTPAGQDRKAVVGFTTGAGVLEPGAWLEIKFRVHDKIWRKQYTFGNDYSYGNHAHLQPWTKIAVSFRGSLVWGMAP